MSINPVIVEQMRQRAKYPIYGDTVEVPFPRELEADRLGEPFIQYTLCFRNTRCVCYTHGVFWTLVRYDGYSTEKVFCPLCVAAWQEQVRRVLLRICAHALAHLHRERAKALGRSNDVFWAWLCPDDTWHLLGPNPSWNPPPTP